MNGKENILGTERISKLLASYAIPGIISMLVNSIYNVVDQIFIGQGVGYLGNGATTVSFPFVQMLLALSIMTSAGTAANMALNLGRKKQDDANHFVGNGFVMAAFWGFLLLTIGEVFLVPLLNFFGATPDNLPYAIDYSRIVLVGFPFVTMGMLMNDVIRADGQPRFAMLSMLSGALVNIVLDPLFIFVMHWGVFGAGLATILGQIVTFILSFTRFRKLRTVHFSASDLRFVPERHRRIVTIGFSAFLSQSAMLISQVVMNNQAQKYGLMSQYGADIPLTCFGVFMKVNAIMISIIIGISNATQPIISYNYGAKLYARIRELLFKAGAVTLIVGIVGESIMQIFPSSIVSIFGQESELYNEFAMMCIRNMTLTIFVMGIPLLSGVYYQAVGKPVQAVILTLSRTLLFLIPLMIIMPLFMGITGVMYSYPVSDVFSIVLASIMMSRELKRLKRMEQELNVE